MAPQRTTIDPPLELKDIRSQVGTLQIAERFFDSILLFTLFRLGVFERLADGPLSLDQLGSAIGGDAETLRVILDAGVAVGLLQGDHTGYSAQQDLLESVGRPQSQAYIGDWLSFLESSVEPLLRLPDAALTGQAVLQLEQEGGGANAMAMAMSIAMDDYAQSRGSELATRFSFPEAGRLLDVGCGAGGYSFNILRHHPGLEATLLDRDGPISLARERAAQLGLSDRTRFMVGDALEFELDEAFDVALVSNVLHMVGPTLSPLVLKHCFDHLKPGGKILIQAEFLNEDRTGPRWPALLSVILQIGTDGGRNHDISETTSWLQTAGFEEIEFRRLSAWNVNSLLIGTKPEDGWTGGS